MLTNLFPHYPDEVALSWFIRYHVISGNISWRYSSEKLFGKNEHNPNILYALNLGFFCSQIPSELKITPDYIINKMTIFPFFKPFMPEERANSVIKGMVDDDARRVVGEIGTNTGEIFLKEGRIIKVCKACLESDVEDLREPYIHRIHQIPGNFLCNKHETPLSYFSVQKDKSNLEIDIDSLQGRELDSFQIKPNLTQYYILLGEDIEFVLNEGLSSFSVDIVSERYRQRLQEKGYVLTGRIKQSRLIADLKQFYPDDFLESLESNIEDKSNKNWLKWILTDSKRFTHPIRHLLFIRFLFGGAKEFSDYSGEYKPFGDGPYPCLNPVADHYKQDVIKSCELKRTHSIANPVGIFKCDCGFIYCRQGPDKTEDDRYRCGKVIQYGHKWDDKLKDLINSSDNIAYIAKEMKCYRKTVIKYATSFGIADRLNTKQRIESKKNEKKISDAGLDVYREAITSYIIHNPDTTRTQIKKALNKEYMLLYIRDKQWLEGILPQPFKDGAIFVKDYKDKDWLMKDEELLKQIKQIVSQILIEEKPRRITRTHIANKVNYYGIIYKKIIKNLPRTEEYLQSCCETVVDFRNREI